VPAIWTVHEVILSSRRALEFCAVLFSRSKRSANAGFAARLRQMMEHRQNIHADQSTTDRKSVVISTRGDARSTGVEALSTSIHSLLAYDPAIAPMIIPDQMPRLSAPAGFIYNVKTVLAEGGQSSLARL